MSAGEWRPSKDMQKLKAAAELAINFDRFGHAPIEVQARDLLELFDALDDARAYIEAHNAQGWRLDAPPHSPAGPAMTDRTRPADLPYTDLCACGWRMDECDAPRCGSAKVDDRGPRVSDRRTTHKGAPVTLDYILEHCAIPEPNSGCWLWHRSDNADGYGAMWVGGRLERAHRLTWMLANGPIPQGGWILHKCDMPCCCNPDHLFLGDQTANMRDMTDKGRQKAERKLGESNGASKLTAAQVSEIYAQPKRPVIALANAYNVRPATIKEIRMGRRWAWLTGAKR